jgi:hypothetical protein
MLLVATASGDFILDEEIELIEGFRLEWSNAYYCHTTLRYHGVSR